MRANRTEVWIGGLVLLAGAQIGVLTWRHLATPETVVANRPVPYERLAIGDRLDALSGDLNAGGPTTFPLATDDRHYTLLLSFHSECAWCATIAPDWAAWLPGPGASLRTLAITRDDPQTAVAYAREKGWSVDVLSVTVGDGARSEGFFVARTPWVFLFDPQGRLLYHGHGADLETPSEIVSRGIGDLGS